MKVTKRLRLWTCICIFFMAAVLCAPDASAQTDATVLRVPFVELDGLMEKEPNGHRHGLVVDYLNEIAKYTGWKYEYIDTTGGEMLDGFIAGKYDLMGGTYYLPAMEQYCAYPEYNTGFSRSVLLARRDDDSIRGADVQTLNGKTIGVYDRAEETVRRLNEFIGMNGLDCTLKYYGYEQLSTEGNLYQYLENGEVDLLLGNSAETNLPFRVVFSYDSQPYYIVTNIGNEQVLNGLNMALEKIFDSNPNFAAETYAANFNDALVADIHLNEDELNYIRQRETISVAVPKSYHPLSCKEFDNLHDGLTQDVLKEVSAFTGLTFSYIYVDTYIEAMHLVQQGDADMMGFFLGSEEESLENELVLTAPYASLNRIVMRNKAVSFPQDGLTCAVIDGVSLPDDISVSDVREYPDANQALAAVNRGEIDFIFGMSGNLESAMERGYYQNVVTTTIVNDRRDICIALARPADPQLLAILNKAINNMSESQKSKLLDQNMAFAGIGQFSMQELVYANPFLFIGILSAFLVLLAVTAVWILRTRMKAAVMRSNMEKAEAESRAKGEFLSHMSHELRTPINAIVGLADLTGMMKDLPEKACENMEKLRSSSSYLLNLINDILDTSRIDNGFLTLNEKPFSLEQMLSHTQDMMQSDAKRRGISYTLEKNIEHSDVVGDITRLRQVITNLLSNAFKFTPEGGSVILRITESAGDEQSADYTLQVIDSGVGVAPQDQTRIFETFEQVESNYSKSQGTGLGLSLSRTIVEKMGGNLCIKSEAGHGSEFFFTITLPFNHTENNDTAQSRPISRNVLEGIHILLVEDNDLNAEIAAALLEAQGASVDRAENGRLAVERFDASSQGDFQVILMDIQMPEMNGLEATRAIRSLEREDAKSVPIIAMTANAFQTDVDAAMKAGMDEFISKPIDVERMYRVLCNLLKR